MLYREVLRSDRQPGLLRFDRHVSPWRTIARSVATALAVTLCELGLPTEVRSAETPPAILISEIHYHPASEDVREEYIELLNAGSTNVHLAGWRLARGVRFLFTNDVVLPPGGYWVVAGDAGVFAQLHPDVTNFAGNWEGILSNRGQELELQDASGQRVNGLRYADEGDWAPRWRGPPDHNHRGLIWVPGHDGGGASLELVQPDLPNGEGQNWAESRTTHGTPGRPNSTAATNVAPLVVAAQHFPWLPKPAEPVLISARVLDESPAGLTVSVRWRLDGTNAGLFATETMHDDGQHEDGAADDRVFAAWLPGQTNRAIVEFYVQATDDGGRTRTWPAPVLEADGTWQQTANALYQVYDADVPPTQPLYRLILREVDRAELAAIGRSYNGDQNSDAQFNGTFLSEDGIGVEGRYRVGLRNRGHGSRNRQPNSYRVNFVSGESWKGVDAINLNAQYTHAQILGSALCLMSGVPGFQSRPVQLRVNGTNLGNNGPQTYGACYAANEVYESDYTAHRFPLDDSGNVYRAVRDLAPSDFAWRGPEVGAYTNTWFKETNASENDWTDLLGMLRVLGTNDTFSVPAAESVADVDEWLSYLAIMALFDNRETSLNNGYNDDYFLHAGPAERRFQLLPYDLDSILGEGDVKGSPSAGVLGATGLPAFRQLLEEETIRARYFRTLERLIDTTFAATSFDPLVDQVLGEFVPGSTIAAIKTFMDARRAHVRSLIPTNLPPASVEVLALLEGVPRPRTPRADAVITVIGEGVTHYRYRVDASGWSAERPTNSLLALTGLAAGGHHLEVLGRTAGGTWQAESKPTAATWQVIPDWPGVCLHEVLAQNQSAVVHEGTRPDMIELFNEGPVTVDLAGMQLSDDPGRPGKFIFPPGTLLAPGERAVLWANDPDGTSGIHLGFSLDSDGEGVYLYDAESRGGLLLDSVVFGLQVADRSLGRLGSGKEWHLGIPTRAAENQRIPIGPEGGLCINEWLAAGRTLFHDDFIEVYNPSPSPVELGGLWLTDNLAAPTLWPSIAPLSYVDAGGYQAFQADGRTNAGARHLAFKLASEQGEIGLFGRNGKRIDAVFYGSQRLDVSQGRRPSGSTRLAFFLEPTPGGPNPGGVLTVVTQTVSLVSLTNAWRYEATADLTASPWKDPGFDDGLWPVGAAVFWYDRDALQAPTNTVLPIGRRAYYFRTAFVGPTGGAAAGLQLRWFVDDGAVAYLNGQELHRHRMPDGEITYNTSASSNVGQAVSEGPFGLSAQALRAGTNVLAVEVHQSALNSGDVAFGLELSSFVVAPSTSSVPVVLNEVLAHAENTTNLWGQVTDWVELYNAGAAPFDLGDCSLTDDPDQPRKWVIPAGTSIGPGEHWVVICDGDRAPGSSNTGFGLAASGTSVRLFASPAQGGGQVDAVAFGPQAADYAIGRVADGGGAWRLVLPTPGTRNLAAALGNEARVRINEWMAEPESGADWFELYNPELQPVAIGGCFLSDDPADRTKFAIPPLTFIGTGGWAYQTWAADNDPGQGRDHVNFKLSVSGDFLGLYDAQARQVHAVSLGTQAVGVSEGFLPDGASAMVPFPGTASRGGPNWVPLASATVHEILAHTDPPWEDALELHNPGTLPLSVGGWWLSNSERHVQKYRLPDATVLAPGGFAVLYEYQFNALESPGRFTFNSAHGDHAVLAETAADGTLTGRRAVVEFGPSANGESIGPVRTSVGIDYAALARPTFGAGQPASLEAFRSGRGAANAEPRISPVVISELHYFPASNQGTNDNTLDEFVELANLSAEPQPLYDPRASTNTWTLEGAVSYVFPTNVMVAGGETLLVVSFDPAQQADIANDFRSRFAVPSAVRLFGPFAGRLGNDGESLRWLKPDPPQAPPSPDAGWVPRILMDQVRYQSTLPWPPSAAGTGHSLQRQPLAAYGNEPLHWIAAPPTPGRTPVATDADQDGLPDDWERTYGLDPTVGTGAHGADGDGDGDGMSNLEEWRAGTAPNTASSVLALRVALQGAAVILQFDAIAGHSYTLLGRDAPGHGMWAKVVDVPPQPTSTPVSVAVPDASARAERFYRLVTPAVP